MNDPDAKLENLPFAYLALPDGAKLRYLVLDPPGTPRGTCLVAQGRREFIEKKYFEVGPDLLARGYRVIFFDWRGQGMSSRFLADDRRQYDHLIDFNSHIKDLHAMYQQVVKPRQSGAFIIFAHSMGALNVTHWLAENPQIAADVKALVMTAPAYMINTPPLSLPISRLWTKLGKGEHYAAGQHDYRGGDRRFMRNMLSHDDARFSVIEKYFNANPEYKTGGVTWGWLVQALTSMRQIRQPGYLERINVPAIALFGSRDIVTPSAKIIPQARRLPNVEIVTIRGAWHDILNEADIYRLEAWRHIDQFLQNTIRG